MDENNRRMCMNFRNNFSRLAEEYHRLGKPEKAKQVLDHCVKVMPEDVVEYNYFMIAIAESYYKLKDYKKGNEIVRSLINQYNEELNFFLSLKGEKRRSVQTEMDRTKYILQQLMLMTGERYKESGLATEMAQEFAQINELLLSDRPL